jgi:hypothetical protein
VGAAGAGAAGAPACCGVPNITCNIVLAFVDAWNALSQCGAWLTTSSAHPSICWLIADVTLGNEMNTSPIPSPVTLLVASSSVDVIESALVALAAGTLTHATILGLLGGTPNNISLVLTGSSAAPAAAVAGGVAGGITVLPNVTGGAGAAGAASSSSSGVDAYAIGVTVAPTRAIARMNRAASCFFSV